jgi:hypothetical protein
MNIIRSSHGGCFKTLPDKNREVKMVSHEKPVGPEVLVAQLGDERTVASAFEKLMELGDSAIPALVNALKKPGHDRETIYSVLGSLESEAAYKVLTDELYRTADRDEQATLSLLLSQDGRSEIKPWLEKQLPEGWQNGRWWKHGGDPASEQTAAFLASLIFLDVHGDWFDKSLESEDPIIQEIVEFIAEMLSEVEFEEVEEE